MACAVVTIWGNLVKWTTPNQKDISHYEVYRRTDSNTAAITTADLVAKRYHITNTETPSVFYYDLFTAFNTSTAYWYWVKSVAYDGQRSTGAHPTITADRSGIIYNLTVDNLNVSSNVSVGGTLHVSGAVTLSSSVTIGGAVKINNTLEVTSGITQNINYVKSYIEFTAIATPAAPGAGIRLYGILSGAVTKLMYVDSTGTTYQLPGAGAGGGNSIYITESASAKANNAAADLYLNFQNEAFNVTVNGQCATVSLADSITLCGTLTVCSGLTVKNQFYAPSILCNLVGQDLGSSWTPWFDIYGTNIDANNLIIGSTNSPETSTKVASLIETRLSTSGAQHGLYIKTTLTPASNSTVDLHAIGGYNVLNSSLVNGAIFYGLDYIGTFFSGGSRGHTNFHSTGLKVAGAGGYYSSGAVGTVKGIDVQYFNGFGGFAALTGCTTAYGVHIQDADGGANMSCVTTIALAIDEFTNGNANASYQVLLSGGGTATAGIWFNGTGGPHLGSDTSNRPYLSTMAVTGNATGATAVYWDTTTKHFRYVSSSKLHKENIRPWDENWYKILSVDPKIWNGRNDPDSVGTGYIAEDLDELNLNCLVTYDEHKKPIAIDYRLMVVCALEIIKDLDGRIDHMDHRLSIIHNMIKDLHRGDDHGVD